MSGFLISCAIRRAASFQAASCCALISSVRSSITTTPPWIVPAASRRAVTLSSKVFHSPPSVRWISLLPCPPRPTSRTAAASRLRSGSPQASSNGRPTTSCSRWRSMLSAAPLQVKIRPCESIETTPAATFSSTAAISARSSASRWLLAVSSRLLRSSCALLLSSSSVIRLKESTSTPSSSSATTSTRCERSPPLIRRVPSARAWIGTVTRRAR